MFGVVSDERNSVAYNIYVHRAFLPETLKKGAMIKRLDPRVKGHY